MRIGDAGLLEAARDEDGLRVLLHERPVHVNRAREDGGQKRRLAVAPRDRQGRLLRVSVEGSYQESTFPREQAEGLAGVQPLRYLVLRLYPGRRGSREGAFAHVITPTPVQAP